MTAYEQALVAATKAATADRDPGPLEALLQAALDEALGSDMPAKYAAAVKARKLLRKLRKQKAQEEEEAEAARAAAAKKKADQEEAEACCCCCCAWCCCCRRHCFSPSNAVNAFTKININMTA